MKPLTTAPAMPCEAHHKPLAWASLRTALVLVGVCLLGLTSARVAAVDGIHGVTTPPIGADQAMPLAQVFSDLVQPRLHPPPAEVARYAQTLEAILEADRRWLEAPQFVLLVDRNPHVQAMLIFWGGAGQHWQLLGASPVSTGLPGRYEHFATPLGVFEHSPVHLDFRAEGTRNALGIRGYGAKGSRIFDFGWVQAPKGWGDHAMSVMRLQMHATDPEVLEPRLGTAQSKGCIRISASLNAFIDTYGLIDGAYEQTTERKARLAWVLREDRLTGAWAGRYLVVMDSMAIERPPWSPAPDKPAPQKPSVR